MSESPGQLDPGTPNDPDTQKLARLQPQAPAYASAEARQRQPVPPGRQPPLRTPLPAAAPVHAAAAARDRLAVHLIWEAILLVIAVVLVVATLASTHGHTSALSNILDQVGYFGFIAAGVALSLRTGSPNLAAGGIAYAAGVLGAHLTVTDKWPEAAAMIAAVAAAGIAGLLTGLLVAALSVPAWAMTLGLLLLAEAGGLGLTSGAAISVPGRYLTAPWLAAFVVVSAGGGALWLIPGVRAALSKTRRTAEPGQPAGFRAGAGAIAGLTGSSVLAGVGGVALALFSSSVTEAASAADLTIAALAAALIGGVSVFGRRAGIAGTVLGTFVVVIAQTLLELHNVSIAWVQVPTGLLIVVGLCMSRVLEAITDSLNRRARPGAPQAAFSPPGSPPPPGYPAPPPPRSGFPVPSAPPGYPAAPGPAAPPAPPAGQPGADSLGP